MTEPQITINGTALSEGQAMTVRVAIASFVLSLTDSDTLGTDEHGRGMRSGYLDRLHEIVALMHTE